MRENNPSIPLVAAGAVLFEQELTPETEDSLLSAWMGLFEKHSAMLDDSWFATNDIDRTRLRDFRHALPVKVNEWLTHHRQQKVSTDMAVPDNRFPAMLDFYQQELKSARLQYVIFGHIGDSHVHVNILPRNDDEAALAHEIYGRFIERAVSVGGTISAEHGIGKLKRDYLKVLYGESLLKEMAALKRVFDPGCILGRGTMFSEIYL
jgi:D-lactate dehydrogenase (cytochrome)